MFHDSQIAKSIQLSKTKCSSLVNYGITPHFQQELVVSTKQSPYISLLFDKTLNDILQEEQMDVMIFAFGMLLLKKI